MTEQRMTEQNGHEEHERNSARDGDAGFAALDATEPHFGSSALGNSVSFEPVAPPVEVGGFEVLNFEAPAALAEPTLTWEAPQATVPAVEEPPYEEEPPYPDEPPYEGEPPYEDEPPYPAEPLYPEAEYTGEYYAGEYWVPSDEAVPAETVAEKPASAENAPKKWVRNRVADSIAAEEFPDWHPA